MGPGVRQAKDAEGPQSHAGSTPGAVARHRPGADLSARRTWARGPDGGGIRRLRDLEQAGADARSQPLVGGGAGAARTGRRQGATGEVALHDPTLGPTTDLYRLLLAARGRVQGLRPLSDQQSAHGLWI